MRKQSKIKHWIGFIILDVLQDIKVKYSKAFRCIYTALCISQSNLESENETAMIPDK
jgi:hypothetical protein